MRLHLHSKNLIPIPQFNAGEAGEFLGTRFSQSFLPPGRSRRAAPSPTNRGPLRSRSLG